MKTLAEQYHSFIVINHREIKEERNPGNFSGEIG